jgi:hypothetical protein
LTSRKRKRCAKVDTFSNCVFDNLKNVQESTLSFLTFYNKADNIVNIGAILRMRKKISGYDHKPYQFTIIQLLKSGNGGYSSLTRTAPVYSFKIVLFFIQFSLKVFFSYNYTKATPLC